MMQSTTTTERPSVVLTGQRLSRMVNIGLLAWLPITFIAIMALGSPNATKSTIALTIFFTIYTYPAYAIVAIGIAYLLNRFEKPRQASIVLAVPAFVGAVIVSLPLTPFVAALVLGDGPCLFIAAIALSLVAGGAYVGWSFSEAPRGSNREAVC